MQLKLLVAFLLAAPTALLATAIPSFPAADLVLGQPNFTSGAALVPPSASSLTEPSAVVVDPATGKVFVADTDNERVLRYASATALTNGTAAELVFGQTDFTSDAAPSPPTATSLNGPAGLAIDSAGRLWVADSDNHRILMFRFASTLSTNAPAADLVLGQPNFTSAAAPGTPSATSLNGPLGITVDATGRLWVADSGNNRVLEYESAAGLGNGAPASGVLGQATFNTAAPGTNQLALSGPIAVAVDATRTLWVADRNNNRVFGYPSAGTISNGTNAARVIGQPDFNVTTPGRSASALDAPSGLVADSTNGLWVLDQNNNRALRFANLDDITNGSPASTVIGQPDFNTAVPVLNNRRLNSPFLGITLDGSGNLWISDLNHHRVLRFAQEDSEIPTVRISGRRKFTTARGGIVLRGTAADDVAVTQVTVKARKSKPRPARGTATWRKRVRLSPGKNVFKAFAFDALGNRSRPARVVITRLR